MVMRIVDVSHKISAPLYFDLKGNKFIKGAEALNISRRLGRGGPRSTEFLKVEKGVTAEWCGRNTVIYGFVFNV